MRLVTFDNRHCRPDRSDLREPHDASMMHMVLLLPPGNLLSARSAFHCVSLRWREHASVEAGCVWAREVKTADIDWVPTKRSYTSAPSLHLRIDVTSGHRNLHLLLASRRPRPEDRLIAP